LSNLCKVYSIDPAWLLLGEGEQVTVDAVKVGLKERRTADSDPVEQLLDEEVERAGLSLTPDQRTAILKILRELVSRDVRSIQELLRSIPGGEKKSIE
jgi:hypothetical protein